MSNPYATIADLTNYGLPATALGTLSTTKQQDALDAAAGAVDSYLRGRYALPLGNPIPVELTEATCKIAAWRLLQVRGFNPNAPGDVALQLGYAEAVTWLNKVQRQAAHPNVVQASNDGGTHMQPTVLSSSVWNMASGACAPKRGW
jgi:phage gp36-like protein